MLNVARSTAALLSLALLSFHSPALSQDSHSTRVEVDPQLTNETGSDKPITPNARGVKEVSGSEADAAVNAALLDRRYDSLRSKVQDKNLFLDPGQAKVLDFVEGYRGVFIPVVDKDNHQKGFLATGAGTWSLSLTPDDDGRGPFEGFDAKFTPEGDVSVTIQTKTPKPDRHAHTFSVGPQANATYESAGDNAACMYVSRYSLHYGCWSPDDNPFGYYYVWTYRVGSTPDPRSPSWRACTWGSIHICPRYETGVQTFPVCGFPPHHRSGG